MCFIKFASSTSTWAAIGKLSFIIKNKNIPIVKKLNYLVSKCCRLRFPNLDIYEDTCRQSSKYPVINRKADIEQRSIRQGKNEWLRSVTKVGNGNLVSGTFFIPG